MGTVKMCCFCHRAAKWRSSVCAWLSRASKIKHTSPPRPQPRAEALKLQAPNQQQLLYLNLLTKGTLSDSMSELLNQKLGGRVPESLLTRPLRCSWCSESLRTTGLDHPDFWNRWQVESGQRAPLCVGCYPAAGRPRWEGTGHKWLWLRDHLPWA